MKRAYIIALHTCYWLYNLGVLRYVESSLLEQKLIPLTNVFTRLTLSFFIIGLCVFYTNYFLVLPLYFKTKRFGKVWIAWICLLSAGIGLRYLVEEVLYRYLFGSGNYYIGTPAHFYIFDNLYFIGLYIVISTVFWTANYWIIAEREKAVLQQQKFDAETAMLKNQVSPHFLFNTLNNIYSLSYKKSDQAPESILKLSGLMRYMLKDSSADKVLLTQELQYVTDFVDLQRLRYTGGGNVLYTYSTDRDDYLIAPLLLIPFIENGFKHGNITDPKQPLSISVNAENGRLHLKVFNRKGLVNKDESSGIGLQNVKLRLELLYTSRYVLDVVETGDTYLCDLTLNLQD